MWLRVIYDMLKVSYKLFIFVYSLSLMLRHGVYAMILQKYTGHNDVSEFCRRRVLPSVFLGRHVLDANSHILHFSRLELPYSCSVGVRAESGSHIILVIQYVSDDSLMDSCITSKHQLMVYEIGETFGGYWGPIPDSVMRHENNFTQLYTIKATQPTTTSDDSDEDESYNETEEDNSTLISTERVEQITSNDYIEVEIPLVNVSGNFSIGQFLSESVDDVLEVLDDDKPRKGVFYETSIMPLLQFSMMTPIDKFSRVAPTIKKKYIASVYRTKIYTPDKRLIYGTKYRRTRFRKKNTPFANRRRNFNKTLSTLTSNGKTSPQRRNFYSQLLPYNVSSTKSTERPNDLSMPFIDLSVIRRTKPQEIIDNIIKSLRQTTKLYGTRDSPIQKILDLQNSSIYLFPNISDHNHFIPKPQVSKADRMQYFGSFSKDITATPIFNYSPTTIGILNTSDLLSSYKTVMTRKKYSPTENLTYGYIQHKEAFLSATVLKTSTIQDIRTSDLEHFKIDGGIDKLGEEKTSDIIHHTTALSKSSNMVTGSMVNHESWENVVQAAPVMAVLLNQSLPQIIQEINSSKANNASIINSTVKHILSRKKRYIQPLQIKNARPRVLTTRKDTITSFKNSEEYMNVQDLSHLVELKDDEIHGRIALRYMRNYVGSLLFNICDEKDPKTRHVYLFNTSRIVIAISNFTLEKMTLIMTPARTLKSKDTSCPPAHLECQISGARVCIDSMTACDRIPNCGAYDIYDEDRLMCGKGSGLQHSVYLAAGTFLAVLLIVIYSVHYWLKRCVPGVSEAFFVYSDRSENILNLETIMQSPNESDLKTDQSGYFFYDDGLDIDNEEQNSRNVLKKLWNLCCNSCFKKQLRENVKDERNKSPLDESMCQPPASRLFSFAELELRKMASKRPVDASVQTGVSLEQNYLMTLKPKKIRPKCSLNLDERKLKKEKRELDVLKFLKESRSDSIQSILATEDNAEGAKRFNKSIQSYWGPREEREILSTVYEPHASGLLEHDGVEASTSGFVRPDKIEPVVRKHLRFDEEATTIPSLQSEDDDVVKTDDSYCKPHVVFGTEKLRYSGNEDNIEEHGNTTGKEFIRFLKGTKTKKSKHKKHDK